MAIKFVGDEPRNSIRWPSGLFTLDKALGDSQGNRGVPGNTLWEIFGPPGVGKTTFATDISGVVAKQSGNGIDYLDLEGQSKVTIESILKNVGFSGTVNWVSMQAKEPPESTVERWTDLCFEKKAGMGILDSVGAYTSTAALGGEITDRNVGLNPNAMGNVAGRLTRALEISDHDRTIMLLNHEHPVFGSFGAQTVTSGGVKIGFLSQIRIRLSMGFIGKGLINFDQGYLIKGTVKKNRDGFVGNAFYAFILKGQGIHRGMTNLWECVVLKEAGVTASKIGPGTKISMEGKDFGKIGDILTDRINDPDFFKPFRDKLISMNADLKDEEAEEE